MSRTRTPPHLYPWPVRWSLAASAFLTICQLFGLSLVGVGGGASLAVYLILQRRAEFIPAILLLNFPLAAFGSGKDLSPDASWYPLIQRLVTTIDFGPGEFNIALASTGAAAISATFFLARNNPHHPATRWLFLVWLPLFTLGVLASVIGLMDGNDSWSAGIQLLSVYPSLIWASNLKNATWMTHWIRFLPTLIIASGLLAIAGAFNGHYLFLSAGFFGPALWYFVSNRAYLKAVTMAIVFTLTLLNFTFTILGIALFSLALFVFTSGYRLPPRTKRTSEILATSALVSGLLFVFLFASGSVYPNHTHEDVDEMERLERLEYKLYSGRAPIWRAAYGDITSRFGDLVVPSGRDLDIYEQTGDLRYGSKFWSFGAHNAYLETGRQAGLAAGCLSVILATLAVGLLGRRLDCESGNEVRILLSCAIAVIVVGGTSGHFVIVPSTGFTLWTLAGLALISTSNDSTPASSTMSRRWLC